jgi:F420-non-reducing hydrogenase iron-sulfur subunit
LNRKKIKSLKLYIFCCSNSLNIEEFTGALSEDKGIEHKIISLPCSGKADILYFIKAFETGADGLVLITCAKNECRYLEGNVRSPRRAEEVRSLLEEIGMGKDRVVVITVNGKGIGHIITRITEFREKLGEMAVVSDFSHGRTTEERVNAF